MSESDGTGARCDDAPPDTSADQDAARWKVFVSSTSFGLRGIRQVAREVIDNFRFDGVKCFEPVVMERFGAQAATPREVCASEVRACDLLVGILGIRYGAHPPDDETSYTELELDTAEEERIPPLMFLLNEEMAAGIEADRPQEEGQADRQNQFRDRALDSLVVEPDVISEEDFRKKLHEALDKWVRDYSFTRELVNHSAEFQRTRRRLLSLSERTGGAALIFGEPGTGKTAMFNALLNDTLLRHTFPHLFSATIRLAEGADEVEQQRARLQSALEQLPSRLRQGDAAPPVLIAVQLEPDVESGRNVDPDTLSKLRKLFTWDVPRAVVLAETSSHEARQQLERDLGWPPGVVTILDDYAVLEHALEQMRRDAPTVHTWPEPETRILAEALGMRPISLFAAAKEIDIVAQGAPRRVAACIRQQLAAIAHEESPEGKYGALLRGSIDRLSDPAKNLLALMTVLHPKPTLFPDEMAVALDLSLDLDDAIAIVTAADDERELDAGEQAHLDNAYDLVAELVGRGLLERMPRQAATREDPELLLTIHPANVRILHDYLPLDEDKRAEAHARAEAFYRAQVGQAISGSFDSRFRMERQEWWEDVEQWIYHLGHTAPDQAGISFATLFMDAYWWWDLYVEFDICGKLLDYANRPRVQTVSAEMPAVTQRLRSFRETYPREHEATRAQIVAELADDDPAQVRQLRATARTAEGIISLLQELCGSLSIIELDGLFSDGIPGQSEPAGPDPEDLAAADQTRLHLLGLICLFLAEGHRARAFLDPAGTGLKTAAACYQTAESAFQAEDNAWDIAWTRFLRGEIASARGEDPGPGWDEAADGGDDESDTELLGNIERARADHLRAHGDLEAALMHYGRAVFYGVTQQVTSNLGVGADAYTQAFYLEMRLHAAKMLAEPLLAGQPSPVEARRRLEVMLGQWGGHWRPDPGALDQALGSASRPDMARSVGAIADAAFFPGPGNAVLLKPKSDYYRRVNELIEQTRQQTWVKGLDRWDKHREETK